MDVKHRITGAVVLVSLAVIFLPMILERPHDIEQRPLQEVPPQPEVPDFVLEEVQVEPLDDAGENPRPKSPGPAATAAEAPDAEPSASPAVTFEEPAPEPEKPAQTIAAPTQAAPMPAAKKPAPKVVSPTVIESGWAVQVGTFKNRASAYRIRDELMADKTGGFIQDYRNAANERLVQVFAGPFLDQASAESAKQAIDRRYKLTSRVVRYQPAR